MNIRIIIYCLFVLATGSLIFFINALAAMPVNALWNDSAINLIQVKISISITVTGLLFGIWLFTKLNIARAFGDSFLQRSAIGPAFHFKYMNHLRVKEEVFSLY